MIKKRLINVMADSKKYIGIQVLWQWISLILSIIMMTLAGQLFAGAGQNLLPVQYLVVAAIVILVCIVLKMICTGKAAAASYQAGSQVKQHLRDILYRKLIRLGASYHEKIPTAEAVQVAVEGIEQLEVYYGKYLPQLIYSLLAPVTLFAALSWISIKVCLILLLSVPLIPLTIVVVQKFARKMLGRYWAIYTGLGDSFLENLQGLTTLKIYQADGEKAKQMDAEAEQFRKITMRVLTMQLNSISVMDLVACGGTALGMIAAIRGYLTGSMNLAGAITIILLSSEFFIPMRLLGSYFHIAMNGMAASDKLFTILDLAEAQDGLEQLGSGAQEVAMDSVTFSYDEERRILDRITLSMPEYGMVSLVGKSGCGKSTVAALLTGRQGSYGGSIKVAEKEISQIAEASLMEHVTLVSHNSYIFKGTVESNLRMAAPDACEEQLWEALHKVALDDFLRQQEGMQTALAERGSNLSGGQRQRLALARALLHDTPVYIFDEAASNIDAESEAKIMEVIRELSADHAVLFISHRLANVVDSFRIYMMTDGRITEKGTHNELMESNMAYAGLYQTQKELEQYA
ncbi:MAG: ABC transporter ATP-binding protein/permease [Lachnospiraceae bacterium]